ncbi:YbaB/EbfC family nucleoid-associated protein [Actinokineospora sp. G85]|uniref:YbaB/EbfC family nucleoid-associated protein n=1 Tax=Actinokineospora sp. G85 TaxID=3406626 RepID=UPI003C790AC3
MELSSEIVELERLKAEIDARLDQVRTATNDLAQQSFPARSDRGNVRAVVDGQGSLLDLGIADGALSRPHPASLGGEVVEAVTAARARASEAHRERFHQILPGMFPAEGENQ